MWRAVKAAAIFLGIVALVQVTAGANGVAVPPAPSGAGSSTRTLTPEEMAVEAYNSGIGHRDRALKAETDVAKQTKESDRVKAEKKARDEHEKALKDFTRAAQLNSNLPQAFNGMGYSYRKLGDYANALENYNRALRLNPRFVDAIEYRAEAYLALNQIDDAKQSYLQLFGMDRKQADSLMKAMRDYVAKKKSDPAGVDPAAIAALESWIAERATLAEQTRQMALNVRPVAWR